MYLKIDNQMPITKNKGFTLIEVMVALVIFLLGIVGCYLLQTRSTLSNSRANSVGTAAAWAQYLAEDLLGREYTSIQTDPMLVNGNGNPDGNVNIDDCVAGTSDGIRYIRPNGTMDPAPNASDLYNVCWNIVDSRPLPMVKQIRIIVIKNAGMNSGRLYSQDYFKLGTI
jgi:prepilin-type N-terminal cleavage/methylation domain-containing protein